jgi:SAM-dependent methyltransferase
VRAVTAGAIAAAGVLGVLGAVTLWGRVSGRRWYAVVYRGFYALGLRVWERGEPAAALVAIAEGPSALSPGRALDLGCGTGTDSVYLARHGWDVTGVDLVPRALALARRRAAAAGVAVRFVLGDVTGLRELGVGGGYALLLDFGCFHTLPAARRAAYVASVSAAAAPGATFLLYGFARPPRLAPMAAGLTPEEVRRRFVGPGWALDGAEPVPTDALRVAGARVDRSFALWCYRLRRRPAAGARDSAAGVTPGGRVASTAV